jgi:hypothetical protein
MKLRDSALQYRKAYLKRLENFEKESDTPVSKLKGLGAKDVSEQKDMTRRDIMDKALQDAFNIIKGNNVQLLAMKEKEEVANVN